MKYEVTSDRAQTVDGLGVFAADETRVFSEDEAAGYVHMHGVPLIDGNVPEGVTVTLVTGGEE